MRRLLVVPATLLFCCIAAVGRADVEGERSSVPRARDPERGPVKIVLVGDSTVATEGGWGPGFCKVMTPNVTCVDVALNGCSSKSFLDEGAWAKALAIKGNYYLIHLGHNERK